MRIAYIYCCLVERKQPVAGGFAVIMRQQAVQAIIVGSSAVLSIFCHLYLAVYSTFDGSARITLLITETIATH